MSVAPARPHMPLLDHLRQVRAATLALAQPLSAEDQMLQSMPDASPVKWHLAHTTWFWETFLLRPYLRGYRPFHEDFIRVFNSYYKQVGEHPNRARRGLFSRPSLEQVVNYRAYVEEHLETLLTNAAPDVEALVTLGIHHEQQHQELILTDIKHGLWSQPLQPAYAEHGPHPRKLTAAHSGWIEGEGGIRSIGFEGEGFCFDNELPRHQVLLQPFRIASRPVTNRDYLEFLSAGGYREPSLWLSEGWDHVVAERWTAPLYWRDLDGEWQEFTLSGWRRLDPDAPVCHISYFEADAYARWRDARLPLESEWEVIAATEPIDGNFVDHTAPTPHAFFGDVWEWTASPYTAYPGYRPAPGAIGEYNGKFMCNQYVLRGGSCATPLSHIRASYRNFFPAHARWQFTGIRIATDVR